MFSVLVARFETNEHVLKRPRLTCSGGASWPAGPLSRQLIGRLGRTWIHCLGNRLRPGHVRIYPQTSEAVTNAMH